MVFLLSFLAQLCLYITRIDYYQDFIHLHYTSVRLHYPDNNILNNMNQNIDLESLYLNFTAIPLIHILKRNHASTMVMDHALCSRKLQP